MQTNFKGPKILYENTIRNQNPLVENMIWRDHNSKYGTYWATEVTKFKNNILQGNSRDWYFSFVTSRAEYEGHK